MRDIVDFGNVITAMVTPFQTKNEQIDLDEVELLANHLLKSGTDSLLLTGSTGEAHQLSESEREMIISRVRRYTPKGTKIIVATSDPNTKKAMARTEKALELGADGILVAVPEYIKPEPEDLRAHFGAIAQVANEKPMLIYNIPGRTCREILPDDVARIAQEHPNVIGIKQSLDNMGKVVELKEKCPKDFQIYSGDDGLTLPMLALGAKGVVSVASHIEGTLISRMIKFFKKDPETAAQINQLLIPLFNVLFVQTNPKPVKEALYQKGLISSPMLRSLQPLRQENKIKLNKVLHNLEIAKRNFLNTPNRSNLSFAISQDRR